MSEPFLGTVMIWAPNFAPRGWAFCKGQIMSISSNSALFSLLGTTYGGDGRTTFGLPNLQGRIPVGEGQLPGGNSYFLGETSGTETVTLSSNQMPAHNHAATFTPSSTLGVEVAVNATTNNATTDAPGSDVQLADVFPNSTRIYAPTGGNQVPLGGVSAQLDGEVGGTVVIGQAGGSQPFPIVQPFQVLNYVIALQGIFPSRN